MGPDREEEEEEEDFMGMLLLLLLLLCLLLVVVICLVIVITRSSGFVSRPSARRAGVRVQSLGKETRGMDETSTSWSRTCGRIDLVVSMMEQSSSRDNDDNCRAESSR